MFDHLIHACVSYDNDPIDYEYFQKLGQRLPVGCDTWAAKRKRDYLAGRFCANQCFNEVQIENFELKSNDDRSPIWPLGYCGSITHTRSFACCVLSPLSKFQSVGIDSEHKMNETTFNRVKRQIASDHELNLVSQTVDNLPLALTIIFSCKEAIFKAIYPLVKKHFYFDTFEIIEVHDNYVLGSLLTKLSESFLLGRTFKISYRIVEDRIDALVTIKNP